jgi:hypothetical protein
MPSSKQPDGYPAVFHEMIEAAITSTEPLSFPCASKADAEHLRFQLYTFAKALRASKEPKFQMLARQASSLIHQIRDNVLILQPRDHTALAIRLTEQLRAQGAFALGGLSRNEEVVESDHMPSTNIPITPHVDPEYSEQEELIKKYMED